MKLLNLNVGIKINNTSKIAEFLFQENADIVTIQEIVRALDKSVLKEYRSIEGIEQVVGNK